MNKLYLLLLALSGAMVPLLAQTENDPAQTEALPVESMILKERQIPQIITREIRSDILAGKPVINDKLPTVKDNYPWNMTGESKDKTPAFYEAFIKGHDGSNVFVKRQYNNLVEFFPAECRTFPASYYGRCCTAGIK